MLFDGLPTDCGSFTYSTPSLLLLLLLLASGCCCCFICCWFSPPANIFFCTYIYWRARMCLPLLCCLCRPFLFLRYVWIRTQRAAVASRRTTNLATHLPLLATNLPHLATHLPHLATHPPANITAGVPTFPGLPVLVTPADFAFDFPTAAGILLLVKAIFLADWLLARSEWIIYQNCDFRVMCILKPYHVAYLLDCCRMTGSLRGTWAVAIRLSNQRNAPKSALHTIQTTENLWGLRLCNLAYNSQLVMVEKCISL